MGHSSYELQCNLIIESSESQHTRDKMKRKNPIEAVGSSKLHTEFHNPKAQLIYEFIETYGSKALVKDIGYGLRLCGPGQGY